jgi:hypothetical protein
MGDRERGEEIEREIERDRERDREKEIERGGRERKRERESVYEWASCSKRAALRAIKMNVLLATTRLRHAMHGGTTK